MPPVMLWYWPRPASLIMSVASPIGVLNRFGKIVIAIRILRNQAAHCGIIWNEY